MAAENQAATLPLCSRKAPLRYSEQRTEEVRDRAKCITQSTFPTEDGKCRRSRAGQTCGQTEKQQGSQCDWSRARRETGCRCVQSGNRGQTMQVPIDHCEDPAFSSEWMGKATGGFKSMPILHYQPYYVCIQPWVHHSACITSNVQNDLMQDACLLQLHRQGKCSSFRLTVLPTETQVCLGQCCFAGGITCIWNRTLGCCMGLPYGSILPCSKL